MKRQSGLFLTSLLFLTTSSLAAQIAPIAVPKTKSTVFRILASDELWFFNQITTLLNYRTTISLNAIGPNTGTFSWDATTNINAVKFENNATSISKTDDSTLHVTSKEISLTPGDITLRFRYNGVVVGDFPLTVRAPSQSRFRLTQISDAPETQTPPGFRTEAIHELRDQFDTPIPRAMEVNEFFDRETITDVVVPNNWHTLTPAADLPPNGTLTQPFGNTPASFFADIYIRSGTDFDPDPVSPPLNGGASAVEVFNVRQRYFAGSEIPGQGRQQRVQIAHFFLDHANPVPIP